MSVIGLDVWSKQQLSEEALGSDTIGMSVPIVLSQMVNASA
ncbi:hypothetical protein PRA06_01555 [Xylella fastidiosa subsp. multiplex]|nr:hypothetical protein [Xylella fastidiosa]MDC7969455.1 hypothetical protein [Xylella fastidiosa subsp. multiplex]